jgi:hypothetical protein
VAPGHRGGAPWVFRTCGLGVGEGRVHEQQTQWGAGACPARGMGRPSAPGRRDGFRREKEGAWRRRTMTHRGDRWDWSPGNDSARAYEGSAHPRAGRAFEGRQGIYDQPPVALWMRPARGAAGDGRDRQMEGGRGKGGREGGVQMLGICKGWRVHSHLSGGRQWEGRRGGERE